MSAARITLAELNRCSEAEFIRICGPLFEHSPWIAQQTYSRRPFATLDELHAALCATVRAAGTEDKVRLIASHPDLVGRLAREGRLTRESAAEQSAAGLDRLTDDEIAAFDRYNALYREKFGFPFVICAREHRRDAILDAFPVRCRNDRAAEIETALAEIGKIARLRLGDAVSEE